MPEEGEMRLFDEAAPGVSADGGTEAFSPFFFSPASSSPSFVFSTASEVMGQIRRKWRVLSSCADMTLRASDSLQVTAAGAIYAQLLRRGLSYRQRYIKSKRLRISKGTSPRRALHGSGQIF